MATGLVAVFGALWTAITYVRAEIDAEHRRTETRSFEARRPFLTRKLELFFEASKVGGALAAHSADINNEEWKKAELRFWALRWSELEMVGNPPLRDAMRRLQKTVVDLKEHPGSAEAQHNVRWMAECLAYELRASLVADWTEVTSLQNSDIRQSLPTGCFQGRG